MSLKETVTKYIDDTLMEMDEGPYYALSNSASGEWTDDKWFKWGLPEGLTAKGIAEDDGGEYSYSKWSVVEFTDGESTVLVKFEGYYQSHVGTEYEGWRFVAPKTKEVVVYE